MEIFKTADMETYNKVYINASALFLIIMDHSADQTAINMLHEHLLISNSCFPFIPYYQPDIPGKADLCENKPRYL